VNPCKAPVTRRAQGSICDGEAGDRSVANRGAALDHRSCDTTDDGVQEMADRELIAATLTAGMLAPAPKAAEADAVRDAVAIYERMLNELRRRFPTDADRMADSNREELRRLGEQNP